MEGELFIFCHSGLGWEGTLFGLEWGGSYFAWNAGGRYLALDGRKAICWEEKQRPESRHVCAESRQTPLYIKRQNLFLDENVAATEKRGFKLSFRWFYTRDGVFHRICLFERKGGLK